MVLHPRRRHKKVIGNISIGLGLVAFFSYLGPAFMHTIWSIYLEGILHNLALVGYVSAAFYVIAILGYFFFTPVIEKNPETKIWIYAAFGALAGYVMFYLTNGLLMLFLAGTLITFGIVLRTETYGILLRDSVKRKNLGKTEGLFYTFSNLAYLTGPLIAGFVSAKYGIKPVFLLSAFSIIIALAIFKTLRLKDIKHNTRDDGGIKGSLKNLKQFFSRKQFVISYIVSGGINLYWGVLFIYIPLFIIEAGLPYYWVGFFMFGVALPLVSFQYKIGKFTDKHGYKKIIIIGYFILALFSLIAFFAPNIYWLIFMFFLASFGSACIEGPTETHFFNIVKKSEEEKFYGPYNTCMDVFNMLGKFIAASVLLFLPQNFIFLALSIEMIVFALIGFKIKSKKELKR